MPCPINQYFLKDFIAGFEEKPDLHHPGIALATAIRYSIERLNILLTGRFNCNIISSPEPKAHGELIVYQSSRRLCVCVSVCV